MYISIYRYTCLDEFLRAIKIKYTYIILNIWVPSFVYQRCHI